MKERNFQFSSIYSLPIYFWLLNQSNFTINNGLARRTKLIIGGQQATAVLFFGWYSRVWLCPILLRAIEIAIKFTEQLVGAGAILNTHIQFCPDVSCNVSLNWKTEITYHFWEVAENCGDFWNSKFEYISACFLFLCFWVYFGIFQTLYHFIYLHDPLFYPCSVICTKHDLWTRSITLSHAQEWTFPTGIHCYFRHTFIVVFYPSINPPVQLFEIQAATQCTLFLRVD